jgi:hypothetical protein
MTIKENLQLLTMLIPTLLLLAAVVALVALPAQSMEMLPSKELLGVSSVQDAQDHLVFEFTPLAGESVAEVGR